MKKAPVVARLIAFLIDITFLWGVSLFILAAGIFGYLAGRGRVFYPLTVERLILFLLIFVLLKVALFLFYFTYLTAYGEQTIGKAAFGMKVVRAIDGHDIGSGRAFARACCYAVSALPLLSGFLMAFLLKGRTLHDMLTGCRAVRLE